MKNFYLVVYSSLFWTIFVTSKHQEHDSSFYVAFKDAVDHFYTSKGERFEIILYGKIGSWINNLFGNEMMTSIRRVGESVGKFEIDKSAVIVVENLEQFILLNNKTELRNQFPMNFVYLVIFEDRQKVSDFDLLLQYNLELVPYGKPHHSGWIQTFSYFLIDSKEEVNLATFEWFTDEACNQQQLKVVDTYSKSLKIWKNDLKIEEKFKNMHNCLIDFHLYAYDSSCYMDNDNVTHRGILIDFNEILGKRGNFKVVNHCVLTYHGLVPEKDSFILNPHIIYDAVSHLVILDGAAVTSAIGDDSLVFLITPPEQYSQWEKVLLPFDELTWTYLCIVFGVAFLATFVINRLSIRIRNLFLGSASQYPAYNILGTFFGISQTQLPEGNFARIILTFFVLFCLVMRTAYQGVLFEMMAANITKRSPENIQDLLSMNFTVVHSQTKFDAITFEDLINSHERPQSLEVPADDFGNFLKSQIRNFSVKIAFFVQESEAMELSAMTGWKFLFLKQKVLSSPIGFSTAKNNFLWPLLSETTDRTIPAGIPQYLMEFNQKMFINKLRVPPEIEHTGPKVLTTDDLYYGFAIWMVTCWISILGFFYEFLMVLIDRIKERIVLGIRDFIGLVLFLMLLKIFLKRV